MTISRRVISVTICALAVLANVVGVGAQEPLGSNPRRGIVITQNGASVGGDASHFAFATQGDDTFVYLSTEMSFSEKVVKGAPYAAQAITEHVQTLADGNRIVRRNAASVYRDSEGRTRRDQTINNVGPYTAASEPRQIVFINDPVAEVNYILDSKNRTARKMDLAAMIGHDVRKKIAEGMKQGAEDKAGATEVHKADGTKIEIARSGVFEMRVPGPGGPPFGHSMQRTEINSKNSKQESLGKQTIEGVEAEGTRSTTTIPAGEMGNEQPINIVAESWYSAELQTVVMSRHSDPRFGESSYRLTNINRSEPAASLFQVPSDYTLKETMPRDMRVKIERERRPKNDQ